MFNAHAINCVFPFVQVPLNQTWYEFRVCVRCVSRWEYISYASIAAQKISMRCVIPSLDIYIMNVINQTPVSSSDSSSTCSDKRRQSKKLTIIAVRLEKKLCSGFRMITASLTMLNNPKSKQKPSHHPVLINESQHFASYDQKMNEMRKKRKFEYHLAAMRSEYAVCMCTHKMKDKKSSRTEIRCSAQHTWIFPPLFPFHFNFNFCFSI